MKIVDRYEINDGQIFSVELAEDRFVDVKVCDGKLDGLIYVVQNEDGSTVYSDKAYSDKGVEAVYPGFEYDEKAVLDLVREAMNKGMDKIKNGVEIDIKLTQDEVAEAHLENRKHEGVDELEKDLLLVLSERVGCMYLSDLKFMSDVNKITTELKNLAPQAFPVSQWNDAITYLTGRNMNFNSAIDAKNFLIGAKIRVAIESTNDYSDTQFHSRLVDSDIRNDDGTYGKVVESYRIVNINENGKIDKLNDRVFESQGAAKEAILSDSAFELVSYDDLVHEAGALLRRERPSDEKLVNIFDLEYDDEGYLHFRVMADGYALEGLYRLYDPANGPDMTLVSIDYGYMHPIIERQWSRIEEALYDASLSRYHDILDKSVAFKEKVINAMEAAGYTYDVLESHEGWETFYGEGGARLGFDRLREAAEWLEGVVFDDPEIGRKVGEIMLPERQEASGSVEAMIGDAKERCIDAGAIENKTQEYVKD